MKHSPDSSPAELQGASHARDGEIDLSRSCLTRKSRIVDVDVDDVLALDEPKDFDLLLGLTKSLSSCVIPAEVLEQGKPSAGIVSAKDMAGFLKYLEHEKSPQLMVMKSEVSREEVANEGGPAKEVVTGVYRYLTSGSPAAEDKDISRAIIAKAKLHDFARAKKIGWVLDAWIEPEARKQGLYPQLTGHSLKEIFGVCKMEIAVAYVRLSPCPNIALKPHLSVGWQLLEGEENEIFIPYEIPSKAEYEAAAHDPAKLENLRKTELIAQAGGMKLGILLYTKERYLQKIDSLLERPHVFENEGDYDIFKH